MHFGSRRQIYAWRLPVMNEFPGNTVTQVLEPIERHHQSNTWQSSNTNVNNKEEAETGSLKDTNKDNSNGVTSHNLRGHSVNSCCQPTDYLESMQVRDNHENHVYNTVYQPQWTLLDGSQVIQLQDNSHLANALYTYPDSQTYYDQHNHQHLQVCDYLQTQPEYHQLDQHYDQNQRRQQQQQPLALPPPPTSPSAQRQQKHQQQPEVQQQQRSEESSSKGQTCNTTNTVSHKDQHNEIERRRRVRIKDCCDMLKTLVPGLATKTDKARVLEQTVKYVRHLKSCQDSKVCHCSFS